MLTLKRRGTTRSESSRQIWDARTLESRSTWRQELPDDVGEEFLRLCWKNPELANDLESFEFDGHALPKLAAFSKGVRRNLVLAHPPSPLRPHHFRAVARRLARVCRQGFWRSVSRAPVPCRCGGPVPPFESARGEPAQPPQAGSAALVRER